MTLSEEEKKKFKKLSPICKIAFRFLRNCMIQVLNGECGSNDLIESIMSLSPKRNDYILPEDYMTVDECLRFLNMDRAQFYQKVVNKHHLEITYFKNKSLGYKRKDIIRFLKKHREKESHRLNLKNKRKQK